MAVNDARVLRPLSHALCLMPCLPHAMPTHALCAVRGLGSANEGAQGGYGSPG